LLRVFSWEGCVPGLRGAEGPGRKNKNGGAGGKGEGEGEKGKRGNY